MKIFDDKKINILIALIISTYVLITAGYIIIGKILSFSSIALVFLFFGLIIAIMIWRFVKGAKSNWPT